MHRHGDHVEVRVTRSLMAEALRDPRVVRRTRTSEWVQIPIAATELTASLAEHAATENLEGRPARTRAATRRS